MVFKHIRLNNLRKYMEIKRLINHLKMKMVNLFCLISIHNSHKRNQISILKREIQANYNIYNVAWTMTKNTQFDKTFKMTTKGM